MSDFRFESAEAFNPVELGQTLCMDFDAVINSFAEDLNRRIKGALGNYIYGIPLFPGDQVVGGIHYAKYVKLATSNIPQNQPSLLRKFASVVREYLNGDFCFFDLGPGPEWSVASNTIPSLHILKPSSYFAVDIEPQFTEEACNVIAKTFPTMKVGSVAADFHKEPLPTSAFGAAVVWYPGSTLGNLPSLPEQPFLENRFVLEHLKLLRTGRSPWRGSKAESRYLVLLMDSKKPDIDAMVNLYTSPEARGCFLSILFKLKRDLLAHKFNPDSFIYNPSWNEQNSTVEHVFTATKTQTFTITNCFTNSQTTINVRAGEEYVLANSIKPDCHEMREMLIRAGWQHLEAGSDAEGQFHIHLASATVEY